MEDFDSPIVLDGYSSVQAIRRAQKRAQSKSSKPDSKEPDKKTEDERDAKSGARIGRSAIPSKFEVVCYECDYTFMMAGRIHDTMCPKCKKQLKATNHIINTEWKEPVKTLGNIDFKAEGRLESAELKARDIILAGNAEGGTIRANGCLTLCKDAKFNIAKMKMKDLTIEKGGYFVIPSTIACRNLEVAGELKTRIFADGKVIIREGGMLDGELHCPHLTVEEGGGLKAKVVIGLGKNRLTGKKTDLEIVSENQ